MAFGVIVKLNNSIAPRKIQPVIALMSKKEKKKKWKRKKRQKRKKDTGLLKGTKEAIKAIKRRLKTTTISQ